MKEIVILICHLAVCDRIVIPTDSCINAEMKAQAVIAQTDLYHDGDALIVRCDTFYKES